MTIFAVLPRHLKDFGFGKSSISEMVMEEYNELAAHFRKSHEEGQELQGLQLFNLSVLNILWRIITGKRHDLNVSN